MESLDVFTQSHQVDRSRGRGDRHRGRDRCLRDSHPERVDVGVLGGTVNRVMQLADGSFAVHQINISYLGLPEPTGTLEEAQALAPRTPVFLVEDA